MTVSDPTLLQIVFTVVGGLGFVGLGVAKTFLARNPKFLVRVGLVSAGLVIVSAVFLTYRVPWFTLLFIGVPFLLSLRLWRRYRALVAAPEMRLGQSDR